MVVLALVAAVATGVLSGASEVFKRRTVGAFSPSAPVASAGAAQPPPAGAIDDSRDRVFSVDVADSPVRGPADAPLTIIEFVDFEGPFARDAEVALGRLEAALPGKVRRVYKAYPLATHGHSHLAARAALAAGARGKFWEMHDALFKG